MGRISIESLKVAYRYNGATDLPKGTALKLKAGSPDEVEVAVDGAARWGVAMEPVKIGSDVTVQWNDLPNGIAGAALAFGDIVIPDANGQMIAGTGDFVGTAHQTVLAAGDKLEILI